MKTGSMLTMIDEPRIVDVSDDDAPLMTMRFHNEWRRRWHGLTDDQKLKLVDAVKVAVDESMRWVIPERPRESCTNCNGEGVQRSDQGFAFPCRTCMATGVVYDDAALMVRSIRAEMEREEG